MRLGALEAGGTKMVCAIGNANGEIYERISIPTETPEITVPKMIEYFSSLMLLDLSRLQKVFLQICIH